MAAGPMITQVRETAFVSEVLVAILFVITIGQAFIYVSSRKPDRLWLRLMVFSLWFNNTLNFVFITYRNSRAILDPVHFKKTNMWNFVIWWTTCLLTSLIVKTYLSWRVWTFSKRNWLLATVLGTSIILALGMDIAFPIHIRISPKSMVTAQWTSVMFITIVLSDGLISSSLCILLWGSRTGIKKTDSIMRVLILYSISTGMLTSIVALIGGTIYLIKPSSHAWNVPLVLLPHLYFNALLANLNARQSILDQFGGDVLTEKDFKSLSATQL